MNPLERFDEPPEFPFLLEQQHIVNVPDPEPIVEQDVSPRQLQVTMQHPCLRYFNAKLILGGLMSVIGLAIVKFSQDHPYGSSNSWSVGTGMLVAGLAGGAFGSLLPDSRNYDVIKGSVLLLVGTSMNVKLCLDSSRLHPLGVIVQTLSVLFFMLFTRPQAAPPNLNPPPLGNRVVVV